MGPLKKQPRLLSHFLKPDVNFCPQFLFLFLNLSLVESIGVECMAMDWRFSIALYSLLIKSPHFFSEKF